MSEQSDDVTQVRVLATGEQTSGRYAVTESTYGPGLGLVLTDT